MHACEITAQNFPKESAPGQRGSVATVLSGPLLLCLGGGGVEGLDSADQRVFVSGLSFVCLLLINYLCIIIFLMMTLVNKIYVSGFLISNRELGQSCLGAWIVTLSFSSRRAEVEGNLFLPRNEF